MSRKTKTITVAGREITFTEIAVNRVIAMLRGDTPLYSMPVSMALGELSQLAAEAIDCPLDDLLDMELYSDDIDQLKDALQETNPAFFDLARRLDLAGALAVLVKASIGAYCSSLPFSPSMDTLMPESMGSAISSI